MGILLSEETPLNYNHISDRIIWSSEISVQRKVTFNDLKDGPFGSFFIELSQLLSTTEPRQLLWHSIHNQLSLSLCNCGSPRNWVRNLNDYRKTCSPACAGKLRPKKAKVPSDYRSNPEKQAIAREKYKATCLKKYGVDHPRKDPTISAKIAATNLEKYGVEIPTKNNEVSKKISSSFKDRFIEGSQERKDLISKRKATSLDRYRVNHPMQSQEIRNRLESTMIDRYGVKHALESEELNSKRKATNNLKYGVDEASSSSVIREKTKETNIERYGVENWMQTQLSSYALEVLSSSESFSILSGMTLDQAKDHLGISLRTLLNYAAKYNLRGIFADVSTTQPELFIASILDSKVEYTKNNRSIIAPLELDFYIPSKQLAIELNGLYWHSELGGGKNKYYHFDKWRRCIKTGINLLQFSSYDIVFKPLIVESTILKYLSGQIFDSRGLFIEKSDDNKFLTTQHIQGFIESNYTLAAYFNGRIVGISAWNINKTKAELVRFASDFNYHGLLWRMVNRFINDNKFVSEIISYSNNDYGYNFELLNCGFSLVGFTPSRFRYTSDYLVFDDIGNDRIWDSGKTKWRKIIS